MSCSMIWCHSLHHVNNGVTNNYLRVHIFAGPEYEKSIQGALLADGLNAFWAALGTCIPLTTYSQNNGVIALSRCASRRAGYACCLWLFLLGIFAKSAAIFISIPNCILGALTSCLVANVVVSGIHVLNSREGLTRRNRLIATLALGMGLGVNLVPAWVNIVGQKSYPNEGNFWPIDPNWSPGYRGQSPPLSFIKYQ
jgi:NCS2 family nucleobase:cation symporter-2